ncbi:conserved hypothetical protein [Verticillium alfalfae VaMs.102]|uniref:Uncharacterized protein n=1 Tax=Verticillium alfalfae (strain VaMs.102 / ATCC MYA-4576 / FGSC 10136) TaxID=526221 RepID=C9S9T3_VERA1|nr:conserved hypothetical protein [Verticillium alfalfae VaMs.102]EEY16146.1 conserved hypothetical protein [Verticillium alfalfae VaMs.102]
MAARREDVEDIHDEGNDMLDAEEVGEEVPSGDEGDVAMDSDNEEIQLQNDSIAYFDEHADSVFAIAQHPHPPFADRHRWLRKVTPMMRQARVIYSGAQPRESTQLDAIFAVEGHTDSINTLAFTLPNGDFLVSGGLDGRLRAYTATVAPPNATFKFLAEAQEVPEINWIAPCPSSDYPNTIALGASDNSVWVYTIDPASDAQNPLQLVNTFWLHTAPCTAGAWTPDGSLLATVAEDSSLYVWDVWGLAASKGVVEANGQTVVSLTGADSRFEVEGGLYSIAVEPNGAYLAVGGAGGQIRIVSLPRLASAAQGQRGRQGKGARARPTGGQPGQQTTLLAAGSVDGSIVVFDATRRFAVRKNLIGAHEDFSVVKVEFVKGTWLLTSCGMDGVVRRWDLRGGAANPNAAGAANSGLVKEWKGHLGDGEGGGVLGFVQGATGERVITAGDDGVVLVFEA